MSGGVVESLQWEAECKDCRREEADPAFVYPDAWATSVVERGGTRSDRCPRHRLQHRREIRSMAVPYIDLTTIGSVRDPGNPMGPLGALGPLPVEHRLESLPSDLNRFDFGLKEHDVSSLLGQLRQKQVAVVVAGTGSGKSTYLPYRLLVPPRDADLRLADQGTIVVTEPRVFAAIDVATFVATQLHGSPTVGPGSDIGYRVKGKPAYDAGCRLLFVTDGSLINWLRDGSLDKFGAVVIDEAHERSKNIDVILATLRADLHKHPRLRVIILSATIDAAFFRDYFGGEEHVAVLEVEAPKRWGYAKLWPDDPVDTSHPAWNDDIEYRGETLGEITARMADLRVTPGPIPVDQWQQRMPALVAAQALSIVRGTTWGDVLAFLPGQAPITQAVEAIRAGLSEEHRTDVYELLRSTPAEEQHAARSERTGPDPRRRVVVSTNIAETSLTIDGVAYVIDSGLIYQSRWDADTVSKSVPAVRHSQDGVKQRWGRVGRNAPGWVFPLYTRDQFEQFDPHTPPEAVRDDLESLVLTAKAAGVEDPAKLVWPASFQRPEEHESVKHQRELFVRELARATDALRARGALDDEDDLTAWGGELLSFSGSPAEAGAIAGADELACAIEMATVLPLLANGPAIGPKGLLLFDRKWPVARRNAARRVHEGTLVGCRDDLDIALKVFAAWERTADREAWARARGVNHGRLAEAAEQRDERLEFLSPGRKSPVNRPLRPELAPRVRAVLSRAFVDVTYVRTDNRWLPAAGGYGGPELQLERTSVCGCDRIVSLRRATLPTPAGRAPIAILGGVVEAYTWAAEVDGEWMGLAIDVANRIDEEDADVAVAATEVALLVEEAFPVGATIRCTIRHDGAGAIAEDATVAERPPTNPLGLAAAAVDSGTDGESPDPGGDELDDLVASVEEKGVGDLVAVLLEPEQELLDDEVEPRFLDVAEAEADDDAPPESAELASSDGDRGPAAGATLRTVRVMFATEQDQGEGERTVQVLGYAGDACAKAIIVREPPDPRVPPPRPGEERKVRALAQVTRWGEPFLLAEDVAARVETCLPAAALTCSRDDAAIVGELPPGLIFAARVTVVDGASSTAVATRLPWVQRHLASARTERRKNTDWYPAHIVPGGRPYAPLAALEHADAAAALLHRFAVSRRLLNREGLSPSRGTKLLIALAASAAAEDGRVHQPVTGVPDGLEDVCDGLALAFEPGVRQLLRAAPGMSKAVRDELLALDPDQYWQTVVTSLWRSANADEPEPSADGWFARTLPSPPQGLAELCTSEPLLRFEPGRPDLVRAAPNMSDETRDRLLAVVEAGPWSHMVVNLHLETNGLRDGSRGADGWWEKRLNKAPQDLVDLCEREPGLAFQGGAPRQLATAAAMTDEVRERLAALDERQHWQGFVTNLWRESHAGAQRDEAGWSTIRATKAPAGLEDILGESVDFVPGRPRELIAAPLMSLALRDRLAALKDEVSWIGAVAKLWKEANTLRVRHVTSPPSPGERRLAEARARFAEGAQVEGVVVAADPAGIHVDLGGARGRVHRNRVAIDIPVYDFSGVFTPGDKVTVTVMAVHPGRHGHVEIDLRLDDADVPSELEQVEALYPAGAQVRGTVTGTPPYGAFVRLGFGLSGLVHRNRVPAHDRVAGLAEGDEVDVVVVTVRQGKRRPEINLHLAG